MAPLPPKSRSWIIILGLLSVAVVTVMATLIYLLLTLPTSTANPGATATPQGSVLSLPTVPLPTTTPGPPFPLEATFAVEESIKGFSDCDTYGFKGLVRAGNGERLEGVQIVIWEEGVGLLTIGTTDAAGSYEIEIEDKPKPRKLWVQVYQNDNPVSDPLLVETQADCRTGFQIYQVNWREKEE